MSLGKFSSAHRVRVDALPVGGHDVVDVDAFVVHAGMHEPPFALEPAHEDSGVADEAALAVPEIHTVARLKVADVVDALADLGLFGRGAGHFHADALEDLLNEPAAVDAVGEAVSAPAIGGADEFVAKGEHALHGGGAGGADGPHAWLAGHLAVEGALRQRHLIGEHGDLLGFGIAHAQPGLAVGRHQGDLHPLGISGQLAHREVIELLRGSERLRRGLGRDVDGDSLESLADIADGHRLFGGSLLSQAEAGGRNGHEEESPHGRGLL